MNEPPVYVPFLGVSEPSITQRLKKVIKLTRQLPETSYINSETINVRMMLRSVPHFVVMF